MKFQDYYETLGLPRNATRTGPGVLRSRLRGPTRAPQLGGRVVAPEVGAGGTALRAMGTAANRPRLLPGL